MVIIEEKQAVLRLRIKVFLGMSDIPQSHVWDEPFVFLNGEKAKFRPDLIVIGKEGVWWWEMKAWKDVVNGTIIKKIFQKKIEQIRKAQTLRFMRKDGKRETDKNVTKVTVVSGEGGFTSPAYKLGRDYDFDMKEPDDLGVKVLTVQRVSDNKLLGVEIRVVPKDSKETTFAPEEIVTS